MIFVCAAVNSRQLSAGLLGVLIFFSSASIPSLFCRWEESLHIMRLRHFDCVNIVQCVHGQPWCVCVVYVEMVKMETGKRADSRGGGAGDEDIKCFLSGCTTDQCVGEGKGNQQNYTLIQWICWLVYFFFSSFLFPFFSSSFWFTGLPFCMQWDINKWPAIFFDSPLSPRHCVSVSGNYVKRTSV